MKELTQSNNVDKIVKSFYPLLKLYIQRIKLYKLLIPK